MDLLLTIFWWVLGLNLAAAAFLIVLFLWLNAKLIKEDEHD